MAEEKSKYPTPKEKLLLAETLYAIMEMARAEETVDAYDVLVILAQLLFPGRKVQLTLRDWNAA